MSGSEEIDRFRDRIDAGQQLAQALESRNFTADFVLAIPRGGLPIGREVADALDIPLDVIIASKIGMPGRPETAIGAVASDGSTWLNEEAIERSRTPDEYVERERKREGENAREQAERYRRDRGNLDLSGKTVLIVDDGIATGSTAITVVRFAHRNGAERVIVAVPVGPLKKVESLEAEADEVICLKTLLVANSIGQFYENFEQITDEEALTYLRKEP